MLKKQLDKVLNLSLTTMHCIQTPCLFDIGFVFGKCVLHITLLDQSLSAFTT